MALNAESIEIWTDVDGIMSADPKIEKLAKHWHIVDLHLMSEMAYSGAKVVHPDAVSLPLKKNIPIYILNTFNKTFPGTKIITKSTTAPR